MNVRAQGTIGEKPLNSGLSVVMEGFLEKEGVEPDPEGRTGFGEDQEGIPGCQ